MKIKVFYLILLIFILISGISFAISETIIRHYNDIKVKLDGVYLTFKDVNGQSVEPFIIDGTTYLPVRALCESLGLSVDWNNDSNTIILSHKSTIKKLEEIDIVLESSGKSITSTKTLNEGEKLKLSVDFLPENSPNVEIFWESSDSSVAKVNTSGVVTAKSDGTAKITAYTASGILDTIKVKVISDTEDEEENYTDYPAYNKTNSVKEDKSSYTSYVKNTIQGKYNSSGLLNSSMCNTAVSIATSEVEKYSVSQLEGTVYTTNSNSYFHSIDCSNMQGALISYQRYKAIAKGLTHCPICNP